MNPPAVGDCKNDIHKPSFRINNSRMSNANNATVTNCKLIRVIVTFFLESFIHLINFILSLHDAIIL